MSRDDCAARDAADPLASLRSRFRLPPGVYLDGNSLGALPAATPGRLAEVVGDQWGRGLVGSWNAAAWITLPGRIGDKIAALIGAGPGEVVVADSTSVNLYKALWAAAMLQRTPRDSRPGHPERTVLLVEETAFPADLYIADSVARSLGLTLVRAPVERVATLLDDSVAVLAMNHVDYRTGRLHDLAGLTRAAHRAGALAVWDLAHSAGAVPVDLTGAEADLAVGCGYKYLNGGPGAPGYLWVHPRHGDVAVQPLTGWLGHAAPFDFAPDYVPAPGVARFVCGTPSVLACAALECGVDSLLAAEPLGGIAALRAKSLALTGLMRDLVDRRCPELTCLTPTPDDERGGQLAFRHREGGYSIVQALIARGVVGDFRRPDVLRFAVAAPYTRYVDVWDAVDAMAEVLGTEVWRQPRYAVRALVT